MEALDNLLIQSNKRETDICEHDFPSKQAFEFTEVGFSFFFHAIVIMSCLNFNFTQLFRIPENMTQRDLNSLLLFAAVLIIN